MRTLLFPFTLFAFCITTAQEPNFQSLLLKKELTTNANAIVRSEQFKVNLHSYKDMTITRERVVTVLNKAGNSLVNAYVHYDKNVNIKELEVRVFDISGNEIKKIKKKEFRDVSAVDGGTLYSDSRVLYLDYTPIKYPYTIALNYAYSTSNTAFIPSWNPLDDYGVSVEQSNMEIVDEAGISLRVKEINLDGNLTIEKQVGGNTYSYIAKNLPALKNEDYSPPLIELVPRVLFAIARFNLEGVEGTATDWESMGKWQHNKLLAEKDLLSEQTQHQILSKVSGISDPLEKAKIVYKYVQDNTRYISVQVGIGGWMPIDAAQVDKAKYGDCKGLTNYTKALLKVVGVEAHYAVVFAGNEKRGMDPDFASMQGNHVILNIPTENGDTWLECTSQVMPFGFLGDFTDNRDVLVVTPEGGKIKRTPVFREEENYQRTISQLNLDERGGIMGKVLIETHGLQYDNHFHLNKSSKEEVVKHYKAYWDYVNNLTVDSYLFKNDPAVVSFQEEVGLSATGYASIAGNRLLFSPNALNRNTSVPDKYKERILPLKINRGYLDEDEFTFTIPNAYAIEALPGTASLQTKFGEYSMEINNNGDGTLTFKRKMLLKEGMYPKEEYEAFREFMKETNKMDSAKVVLVKKNT